MSDANSAGVVNQLEAVFVSTLEEMRKANTISRIWQKDATVWSDKPEHHKIIANSLGWLTVPQALLGRIGEVEAFAAEVRAAGFTHAVVLGMGGSSLCPEVLRKSFGPQKGWPELLVLDSTVPAAVEAIEAGIKLETTLFLVASKSGSTTEPQMFQRYFFERVKQLKGERAGENFVAITDPGTILEQQAKDDHYRKIFLNWPDIGGRYSALSLFGMAPFAVMGGGVRGLVERAASTAEACRNEEIGQNPGATLGVLLGVTAIHGVDKLTLITSPEIASLGLWIEQLVAESTGKAGRGIVPVAGEKLGEVKDYGADRLFVAITTERDAATAEGVAIEAKLKELEQAGFPVVHQKLSGAIDLGAAFFIWEFATAVACALMKVDAFDQPNVQESKDNTKKLLAEFTQHGAFPAQAPVAADGAVALYSEDKSLGATLAAALRAHLSKVRPGDYVAITQYFAETAEVEALVQRLRTVIHEKRAVATTTGYGPRFLHSTGQLHKGGGDNGVFIQLTAADARDVLIPREPFGFSVLKQAQSLGDMQSLIERQRRAVRIDLGADVAAGLRKLIAVVEQA